MRGGAFRYLAGLAALLSGCAFPNQLTRQAVDHNEVVARTVDNITFANILRAKARYPLHFTSISRISGNTEVVAGASLAATFQPGGDLVSPGLNGSVGSNPSYDMAIEDSQEFQQGILASIPPSTVNYYLSQGWGGEILSYLFIDSVAFVVSKDVTVTADDGAPITLTKDMVLATLDNSPNDDEAAPNFENFVACYRLAPASEAGTVTKLQKLGPDQKISDLALLDGKKFDVRSYDGENWVVRLSPGSDTITLKPHGDRCAAEKRTTAGVRLTAKVGGRTVTLVLNGPGGGLQPARSGSAEPPRPAALLQATGPGGRDAQPVETSIDLTLRSTEGIIYFLGEYARCYLNSAHQRPGDTLCYRRFVDTGSGQPAMLPILDIRRGGGSHPAVSGSIQGETYHVPGDSRSVAVIAMVENLINLQKSAKDQPISQTVRVIK